MEVGFLRLFPTSVPELLSGFAEISELPLSHSIKHCLISEAVEEWKAICDPVANNLYQGRAHSLIKISL